AMKFACGLVAILLGVGGAGTGAAKDPAKTSIEELIAGHLASLGTPEARAAVTARLALGKVNMHLVQGGVGALDGKAFLLGEGRKFRVSMPFNYADYWGEQILYDASKANVGFSQPGVRSGLGSFVTRY